MSFVAAGAGKVPFGPFGFAELFRVWIILAVWSPDVSVCGRRNEPGAGAKHHPAPSFDDISIREVFATAGQTLLLPCTVKNLGNKVVSWIRSKDLNILTWDGETFTGDGRFEAVHTLSSGDFWGLRLRGARVSDTGQYECQVNTEPKMSLAISLTVTVAGDRFSDLSNSKWVSKAVIKGPATVYVQNGTPVTFYCKISPLSSENSSRQLFFSAKPPVRWLHDGKQIDSQFGADNVTVDTVYGEEEGDVILSKMHLASVSWTDGGEYTCMQPSSKPDSVKLIVVEGEHSEAMQRDFPIASPASMTTNSYIITCVLIFVLKFITFSL